MYAKALRELVGAVRDDGCQRAAPLRESSPSSQTWPGLLKPRRATGGTIQFTPASGPVKHEEDSLAGRRADPPALPGVLQGLRLLLRRVGAVRCAEAALKGGGADRHFPHENSPHALVTRESGKGCHLRRGVPLVEQSFCHVEPDHLHVPGRRGGQFVVKESSEMPRAHIYVLGELAE